MHCIILITRADALIFGGLRRNLDEIRASFELRRFDGDISIVFEFSGPRFHAKADGDADEVVDPPKVEEKIGAVPHGLSTDSDVVKRFVNV